MSVYINSVQTHSHITEKPRAAEYQEQNWAGNTDEHWASRAPADRGRGSVPPWTATDGCRQAKCINTTGDPCLHHLHLFLEPLHPPLFFLVVKAPSVFSVLPEVQSVAEGAPFFFYFSASFIVMKNVTFVWDWLSHVLSRLIRLLYLQRWTIM